MSKARKYYFGQTVKIRDDPALSISNDTVAPKQDCDSNIVILHFAGRYVITLFTLWRKPCISHHVIGRRHGNIDLRHNLQTGSFMLPVLVKYQASGSSESCLMLVSVITKKGHENLVVVKIMFGQSVYEKFA